MRLRLMAKMGNANNNAFKFRKLFQVRAGRAVRTRPGKPAAAGLCPPAVPASCALGAPARGCTR